MILTPQEYEKHVVKKIHEIFEEEKNRASKIIPFLPEHLDYLEKLTTTNGKKIRAYLIYLGYKLYGKDDEKYFDDILLISSAIEIFHTAILIHDDITDQSKLRRGMKSFHEFEIDIFKNKHIAENTAMYFGDFGLFLAQDVITRAEKIDSKLINMILHEFNRIALDLAYGQIYDLVSNFQAIKTLPFEELLKIYNLKTGTYTFLLPLKMGIIASGNIDKLDFVDKFAFNAGIVFQLTDDLLDIFNDPNTSGKPSCNDIREGKINSVTRIILDTSDNEDKKYLERLLQGKEEINQEKVIEIAKKEKTYNAILSCLDKFVEESVKEIENFKADKSSSEILTNVIVSLKNREK